MDYKITEDTQIGVAHIDLQPYRAKFFGIVGKTIPIDISDLHLRFTTMNIDIDKEGNILGIEFY